MELQQLKYFLVLAGIENVTKAAESLNIAQPALSQSIKRLEKELGVPLFERTGRRLHLNEAGRFFEEKVKPLMQTLDALPRQVQDISGMVKRTVRVSALSASQLSTEIIIAYRELHPEVNFIAAQVLTDNAWDICFTSVSADMTANEASGNNTVVSVDGMASISAAGETALTSASPATQMPHMVSSTTPQVAVFDEEIFLAVPQDKLSNYQPVDKLASFADAPFITFTGAKPFKTICDHLCSAAGFTPRLAFQSDSPTAVHNLIDAGLGVAFWPSFSWGPVNSSRVKLLHISMPSCRRKLLIQKSDAVLPGSMQEDFYRFAVEYVQRLRDELSGC